MPHFSFIREHTPNKSFRTQSVIDKFDLSDENHTITFSGNIDLPANWQIGLIVGASGTGKTTIAKELFGDNYVTEFNYSNNSVIDDMPANKSVNEICSIFSSVGFSSPPCWVKPYHVLSNGQKMRIDLANAILTENKMFVFDEFTSVVDRQVAQVSSYAVQKAIRKSDKQFIAVSCHYDVEDWLLPDWVFDTNLMEFRLAGKKKDRRSECRLNVSTEATGSVLADIII